MPMASDSAEIIGVNDEVTVFEITVVGLLD